MSKQDRRGAIDQALDQMFADEEAAMRELEAIEDELFDREERHHPDKIRRHREKEPLRKMRGYDG